MGLSARRGNPATILGMVAGMEDALMIVLGAPRAG